MLLFWTISGQAQTDLIIFSASSSTVKSDETVAAISLGSEYMISFMVRKGIVHFADHRRC